MNKSKENDLCQGNSLKKEKKKKKSLEHRGKIRAVATNWGVTSTWVVLDEVRSLSGRAGWRIGEEGHVLTCILGSWERRALQQA